MTVMEMYWNGFNQKQNRIEYDCEPDCEEIDAVYRKLEEYEDLEEQVKLLQIHNGKLAPT